MSEEILSRLAEVVAARKASAADSSYVASLYANGSDQILKKIGEEATELVLAGKGGTNSDIVHETADLWFHTLVLLVERGLHPDDVMRELEKRFGRSGLEEKAARESVAN